MKVIYENEKKISKSHRKKLQLIEALLINEDYVNVESPMELCVFVEKVSDVLDNDENKISHRKQWRCKEPIAPFHDRFYTQECLIRDDCDECSYG